MTAPFRFEEQTVMPLYVYEVLDADGNVSDEFEILQKMSEDALTTHPTTGQPMRRKIQAPFVAKKTFGEFPKSDISDKNLDRLGFTKYQKKRDGSGYEKLLGDGPDINKL